jgi:choloylglycine hydrolase
MKKISVLIFFIIALSNDSHACVTFIINAKDSLVFGWNYEFDCGSGFLIDNKKGLRKTSFVSPDDKPIKWLSKYGSITFNQWGKEFPSGGINEMGLVVVQTMFVKTQYVS